jgi:osmoprotectant transport system ATP-binding protein
VIQQVGLFPHLTVAQNVGMVPGLLGWDKARTAARVDELLDLVGLDPAAYRGRYPRELSGGQGQRVGVARAMAGDPPVLLMDEPFGAIDPLTRDRLQNELLRIQSTLRRTIVFVTHDIDEAIKLGDRIAILTGRSHVEQYDTPEAVLTAPATPFVADFIGSGALLKRLDLTRVGDVELAAPDGARTNASVTTRATLRDALDALVGSTVGRVAVTDAEGHPVGVLDLATVMAAVDAMRNGTVAEGA